MMDEQIEKDLEEAISQNPKLAKSLNSFLLTLYLVSGLARKHEIEYSHLNVVLEERNKELEKAYKTNGEIRQAIKEASELLTEFALHSLSDKPHVKKSVEEIIKNLKPFLPFELEVKAKKDG
jgi:hypothetical protein